MSTILIPPDVTPQVGLVTAIAVGGSALLVFPAGAYGGYIVNPYLAGDQNIMTAEDLFLDPFQPPQLQGFGTTVRLFPGQLWSVPIAKSTAGVWVNGATTGHRFTAVFWVGP